MIVLKGPIFKEPIGPSERSWYSGVTEGPITCQVCGTVLPEKGSDTGYEYGYFLGLQLVGECCGKILDDIYERLGSEFTMAFLCDFSENPLDIDFGFLRFRLPDILKAVHRKAKELSAETAPQVELTNEIKEAGDKR